MSETLSWTTQPESVPSSSEVREKASPFAPPPKIDGIEYFYDPNGRAEELGHGSYGVVYLGFQKTPPQAGQPQGSELRKVAIKVLRGGPDAREQTKRRFLNEAKSVASMKHPNIVEIYSCGEAEGCLYLVMEYLSGKSLRDKLNQGPAAPREAAIFAETLARGLQAAHAKVVHRDLTPANVLFAHDGTAKITDFGLAKRLDADQPGQTARDAVLGTPGYMAPEQAGQQQEVDGRADVHALGAILYEMLTGQRPYRGATHLDTILLTISDQMPQPPALLRHEVPRDLDTIVMKCLAKEPARRYTSAQALADDLERFVNGEPILARPLGVWERAWRRVRRRPLLSLAIATVTSALLLLLFLAGRQYWRAETEVLLKEQEAKLKDQEKQRADENAQLAALRRRETTHQRATFDLQMGKRAEALISLDALVSDPALPPEERDAIRVERLPCLFLQEHWPRLKEELKELSDRALPSALRAHVLLHRGDVGLWQIDVKQQRAARKDLEEALRLADGLRPADIAYARGLLTDSAFEAAKYFEEALDHDPYHARARVAALLELVLSGRFTEAQRHLDVAVIVHPEEPIVPLAGALMGSLQRKPEIVKHHRDRLRQLLNEERFLVVERLIPLLGKTMPPTQAAAVALLSSLPAKKQLAPLSELGTALGVASPTLNRFVQLFMDMNDVYARMVTLGPGDAVALCERCATIAKKHPEALVRYAHVFSRLALSQEHLRANRFDLANMELKRADQLSEEVSRSPTILPTHEFHRDIDWFRVILQASLAAQRKHFTHGLAAAVSRWPNVPGATVFNPLLGLSMSLEGLRDLPTQHDRNLIFRVAETSHGKNSARTQMLPSAIMYFPLEDGRVLLADWEADEPAELLPLILRAEFEAAHGNRDAALAYISRVLDRSPREPRMLKLREKIGAK